LKCWFVRWAAVGGPKCGFIILFYVFLVYCRRTAVTLLQVTGVICVWSRVVGGIEFPKCLALFWRRRRVHDGFSILLLLGLLGLLGLEIELVNSSLRRRTDGAEEAVSLCPDDFAVPSWRTGGATPVGPHYGVYARA